MLRLNGLTEYWKGLSGRIWNVEDDGTTCDILINKLYKIASEFDKNVKFSSQKLYTLI